jgi:hypothetical protein
MADTMRKNTDAGTRGGAVRSSEEVLVTRVERRDSVIRLMRVANPFCGDERHGISVTFCYSESLGVGSVPAGQGQPRCCGRR